MYFNDFHGTLCAFGGCTISSMGVLVIPTK